MKWNIFLISVILFDSCIGKYLEGDPFGTKTSYFSVANLDERLAIENISVNL